MMSWNKKKKIETWLLKGIVMMPHRVTDRIREEVISLKQEVLNRTITREMTMGRRKQIRV